MKLLVFLIVATAIYIIFNPLVKKSKFKRFSKWFGPLVFVSALILFMIGAFLSSVGGDQACGRDQKTVVAPSKAETANDYFSLGDYQFDNHDCRDAISSYSKAIELNPKFAQAYNNRAYTYMRLQEYQNALRDLNKAISIRPDYVFALMNRGDIYNYYFQIDRNKAITDYNRVISIVKSPDQRRNLSVCGHKLIAENGGWTPKIYLQIFHKDFYASCN